MEKQGGGGPCFGKSSPVTRHSLGPLPFPPRSILLVSRLAAWFHFASVQGTCLYPARVASHESFFLWTPTTAAQVTARRRTPASCRATFSPPITKPSASTIYGSLCSAFFLAWACRCSCVSIWHGRECISGSSPASAILRIALPLSPRF